LIRFALMMGIINGGTRRRNEDHLSLLLSTASAWTHWREASENKLKQPE
jgi:hypothetical protein